MIGGEASWRPLRTTEEEEESAPPRARSSDVLSLICMTASVLLLSTSVIAIVGGLGPSRLPRPAEAQLQARPVPAEADEDRPVMLTSTMIDGVRFSPAGITLQSTECPPFVMDPNRTTREHMEQLPLALDRLRGLRSFATNQSNRSRCTVQVCDPVHPHPGRVVRMQDVCLHNETFYLLSDRDSAPVPFIDDWWGDPTHRRRYRRYLQEVSSERLVPGTPIWLDKTWVAVTPKFRFGKSNVFHAILEEIGWLGRMMQCARLGTGPEIRFLLLQHRKMLGRSVIGRLWELAGDGARSYFIPSESATSTFCFRHLHAETDLVPPAHEPMEAMCTRMGELHEGPPPAWPGWPAGRATFTGFPAIVSRACSRLGLPAEVGLSARRWSVPRVTVVHRLKNRRLLNIQYVAMILRDAGFHVTVVSLECMPLEAQLAVVANSSTLIGVHGAGMTLGHALPPDALVLELRTAPCTEEARGIPYQMRPRNQIIPALRVAVMPNGTCPPPWKYNRRDYEAVVDIEAVLHAIRTKDPIASGRQR